MKKILILTTSILIILSTTYLFKDKISELIENIEKENLISTIKEIENQENIRSTESTSIENIEKDNESTTNKENSKTIQRENDIIKKAAYIECQFICQAPLETSKNWELHEESCEEAALLQSFLAEQKKEISKEEANEIILEMIEYQKENFNGHNDIYADDIKKLAINFWDLKEENLKIIYDADLNDIKRIISSGHTVMAPVMSKHLENPFYPYPGYHMLQVIGYDESQIITNDNGTRRGKDYAYSNEKFEKALNAAGADILYFQF